MGSYSFGITVVRYFAEREAKSAGFEAIVPEHLWMALASLSEYSDHDVRKMLDDDDERVGPLIQEVECLHKWFQRRGMHTTKLRRGLRQQLGKGPGSPEEMHRSPECYSLYDEAWEIALADGANTLDTTHLAAAIARDAPAPLAKLLAKLHFFDREFRDKEHHAKDKVAEERQAPKASALVQFGRDLTAVAAEGRLEPPIGRRTELLHLFQLLARKRKNGVILVGDPGVGKTCLIQGLACRIASPKCPPAFRGKRLVEVSGAALMAGTQYRGDLEARVDTLIREAEADPDVILFMDEFHTVVGRKGSDLSVANMLKPALARGHLHVIGATTTTEYDSYLAKDDALARRFEVMWLEEPSRDKALEILSAAQKSLQEHHGVVISDDAVEASVDLSVRYLPSQRLPDKALDLLDHACAQQAVHCLSMSGYTLGSGEDGAGQACAKIGRDDVARVLADRVRIPFELLCAQDEQRFKLLQEFLSGRVVGQATAIATVCEALRIAWKGLRDPRRPMGSFLFAGPTGVGKTETAKGIAEFMFGDEKSLIQIDLSEYTEKHQIARLIGAPPGYVGHDQPGMLTTAVRQRPASVVLFDEIDKAHPEVLNILLQILDEGHLTDGQGRKAWFRETIVVLTTNIMPDLSDRVPLGFAGALAVDGTRAMTQQSLLKALSHHMRPELLGRIHNVVVFNPLDKAALVTVAEKSLEDFWRRLGKEVSDIPDSLRKSVSEKIASAQFGAREIQRLVESEIAEWLKVEGAEATKSPSFSESEASRSAEVALVSSMPMLSEMDVALLVLDMVGSTQFVCTAGDTIFANVITRVSSRFRDHASASHLLFLKCTGDGFLAVYDSVPDAFRMARELLEQPPSNETLIRIGLHWGTVKRSPDGEPLGAEVHRVFRIEGVKVGDREGAELGYPFPEFQRLLVTRAALDHMDQSDQSCFRFAGPFRLKGFEDPCDLWVAINSFKPLL